MKTEIYSWRLPQDLKIELEREARLRETSVAALLDAAARELLKRSAQDNDEERQRMLHERAAACIGSIEGHDPSRAETARQTLRTRLRKRHAR